MSNIRANSSKCFRACCHYRQRPSFGRFSATFCQFFLACLQQASSKLPQLAKNRLKIWALSVVATRPIWADMFEDASLETRRMIAAYLIQSVKVSRGYELDITLNVAFEQFFNAS